MEAREDERKETAVDVLANAVAWFVAYGVTVQRGISDDANCYKSSL